MEGKACVRACVHAGLLNEGQEFVLHMREASNSRGCPLQVSLTRKVCSRLRCVLLQTFSPEDQGVFQVRAVLCVLQLLCSVSYV